MKEYSFFKVLNKSYFQKSRMTALGETDFIQYKPKNIFVLSGSVLPSLIFLLAPRGIVFEEGYL